MRNIRFGIAAAIAALMATPAAADTVTDWWDFARRVSSAAVAPTGGLGTPDQFRGVSRTALAMFEAVNAIDRRYESYLNLPAADPTASQDAAAVTAAYQVLLQTYPGSRTAIEESYAFAMASIPEGPAREAGRLIGVRAAEAALAAGGLDPDIALVPYRPRTAPGEWIGGALPLIEPYMVAFRPWAIPSADALLAPPPPPLSSERYARDYEEVRRLGSASSTERTPLQTLTARYYQAHDIGPTMRLVANLPGRSAVRNARMLALYHMAIDDSALAMSQSKMHYNYWRPITAIRNGADDGNDATQPDPAWVPLLPTPNFSEYPCGHCTAAAAIAEVMISETGPAPPGGVLIGSQLFPLAAPHTLPTWTSWAQAISNSRIYGGVHYRFSNEAGEEIGRRAARMVMERLLRPLPEPRARQRR